MRWSLVCLLVFSGCGSDDGDKDDAAPRHALYVADSGSMPTCDAAAEGWLIYVAADSAMKACLGGTWTDVGAGGGLSVEAEWYCGGTSDLDPTENELKGLSLLVTKFSTGDYFMSCMSGGRSADGDSDTLGTSTFIPKKFVTTSEILCVSLAAVKFNTETTKAKYFDAANQSASQEVSCTKR